VGRKILTQLINQCLCVDVLQILWDCRALNLWVSVQPDSLNTPKSGLVPLYMSVALVREQEASETADVTNGPESGHCVHYIRVVVKTIGLH